MKKSVKLIPWLIWGISTFFVIFQFFLQISAGVMADQWKVDFHLSDLGVANLSAAFFYIYIFMQIPVGLIYDRFNSKFILGFASIALALGSFLFAHTHNYYIAFLTRMLMGIGATFGFIGMLYVTAQWFSNRNFPFMVSLAETVGMLFVGLTEVAIAWLVVHNGWRSSMNYAAFVALAMSVIIFLVVRDRPKFVRAVKTHKADKPSIWKTLCYLSKNKQIWLLGIFGFFNFSLINVFTSLWGVPFLVHTYHVNLHIAAKMVSMVFVGIAAGSLVASWLSVKLIQRKLVMLIGTLLTGLLFTFLLFVPNLPHFIIYVLLLLSGFFCASYVLCYSLTKETIPSTYRATALAMTNMLIMLSAPVLQPLVGFLIGNHIFGLIPNRLEAYRVALAILPAGLFISALLVLLMKERYHAD